MRPNLIKSFNNGKGKYIKIMKGKDDIRKDVWQRLREVAYPDSRFDYDFTIL